MRVGAVVAMAFQVQCHLRANGVVRGLHEIGGLQELFVVVEHRLQEFFSGLDTSEAGSSDDGVR